MAATGKSARNAFIPDRGGLEVIGSGDLGVSRRGELDVEGDDRVRRQGHGVKRGDEKTGGGDGRI